MESAVMPHTIPGTDYRASLGHYLAVITAQLFVSITGRYNGQWKPLCPLGPTHAFFKRMETPLVLMVQARAWARSLAASYTAEKLRNGSEEEEQLSVG